MQSSLALLPPPLPGAVIEPRTVPKPRPFSAPRPGGRIWPPTSLDARTALGRFKDPNRHSVEQGERKDSIQSAVTTTAGSWQNHHPAFASKNEQDERPGSIQSAATTTAGSWKNHQTAYFHNKEPLQTKKQTASAAKNEDRQDRKVTFQIVCRGVEKELKRPQSAPRQLQTSSSPASNNGDLHELKVSTGTVEVARNCIKKRPQSAPRQPQTFLSSASKNGDSQEPKATVQVSKGDSKKRPQSAPRQLQTSQSAPSALDNWEMNVAGLNSDELAQKIPMVLAKARGVKRMPQSHGHDSNVFGHPSLMKAIQAQQMRRLFFTTTLKDPEFSGFSVPPPKSFKEIHIPKRTSK